MLTDFYKNNHNPILKEKEGENMDEMTTPEVNSYLELIAKLVEATAKTPEDAARIVRESKVK